MRQDLDTEPFKTGSTQLELNELNELITDLNKKAALGRRNRKSASVNQFTNAVTANYPNANFEETVKRRFERDVPLTQAAMARFTKVMRSKAVKVIWFAAGKTDVVKMLKECKMWAEVIPAEISKAETELGRYFSGAGKFYNFITQLY